MADTGAMDVDPVAPLPLLSQLNGLLKEGNDAAVLKSVEKILTLYPRDVDVGCVKAVALLQLNRPADALAWFNSFPDVASRLPFERAYGLYRLGALKEALEVVDGSMSVLQRGVGETSDSLLLYRLSLLRAQVLYRLEQFRESAENFGDQRASVLASDAQDLVVNYHGALARSGGNATIEPTEVGGGYDAVYNAACVSLANLEYSQALERLRSAEALAKRVMEEDEEAEEDVAGDLWAIRAQTAYVLQLQEKQQDAADLYSNILSDRGGSRIVEGSAQSTVLAIAANNLVAMRAQLDVHGARRALKKALDSRASARLLSAQRNTVQQNLSALTEFAQSLPAKAREAAPAVSVGPGISSVGSGTDLGATGSALGVPGAVRVRKPGRKKKKKVRLPKNYDPNVQPDPERWLPRRERSTFKKKKGRGKLQQQSLQQGSLPPSPAPKSTKASSSTAVKAARGESAEGVATAGGASAGARTGTGGVEAPRKPQGSKKKSVAQKKRKKK